MSDANEIAKLKSDNATLKARLNVMSQQRNQMLDEAVVSRAAVDLYIEALQGHLRARDAEIRQLKEAAAAVEGDRAESEKQVAPSSANSNGRAEACPQA